MCVAKKPKHSIHNCYVSTKSIDVQYMWSKVVHKVPTISKTYWCNPWSPQTPSIVTMYPSKLCIKFVDRVFASYSVHFWTSQCCFFYTLMNYNVSHVKKIITLIKRDLVIWLLYNLLWYKSGIIWNQNFYIKWGTFNWKPITLSQSL
jgi:hypothetical protein